MSQQSAGVAILLAFTAIITAYLGNEYGKKALLYFIIIEFCFITAFIIATQKRDKKIDNILIDDGDKIVVNGVFKKKEFSKNEVIKIIVTKDFLSKVFDFSRVTIQTKQGQQNLYTAHVSLEIKEDSRITHSRLELH